MTDQLQLPIVVPQVIDAELAEQGKRDGIARADEATPTDWSAKCDAAIAQAAAKGEPFQAADLIAWGLLDEEPVHPNQWGARFGANARRGVIRDAGAVQSKRATVHRSLCRQWIGTGHQAVAA